MGKKEPQSDDGTFYQNGKVRNRKNYYAKNCEYVYNPDGSIASKKCYFPFDLADRKLKVDKKSGLVISSYDEKNNILTEYSYIYDSGDPYVTACSYKGKKRTKPIECIDVTRESDTLWWTVNKDKQICLMKINAL